MNYEDTMTYNRLVKSAEFFQKELKDIAEIMPHLKIEDAQYLHLRMEIIAVTISCIEEIYKEIIEKQIIQ